MKNSPFLNSVNDINVVVDILKTSFAYGNSDVIYLFSKTFRTNVCIHVINNTDDRTNYAYFKAESSHTFLHLKLHNQHYTPLVTISEKNHHDRIEDISKNLYHHENNNTNSIILNNRNDEDIIPITSDTEFRNLHGKINNLSNELTNKDDTTKLDHSTTQYYNIAQEPLENDNQTSPLEEIQKMVDKISNDNEITDINPPIHQENERIIHLQR